MSNRSPPQDITRVAVITYVRGLITRLFDGKYGTVEAQETLEQLGLSQPLVARILKGESIGLATVIKVADAEGVPVDEVIGRVPRRKKSHFPNLELLLSLHGTAYWPGAVALARGLPLTHDLTMAQWREVLLEITFWAQEYTAELEQFPPPAAEGEPVLSLPTRRRRSGEPPPSTPPKKVTKLSRRPSNDD